MTANTIIQPSPNLLIYRNPIIFDRLMELNLPYESALAAYQIAFLIRTGMGIDRTARSVFNLASCEIPNYRTEKSFEELVYERALYLKNTSEELTVILSHKHSFVILKSLLDVGSKVNILATKQFADMNKTIFDHIECNRIDIVDRREMINAENYKGKIVTGEHGNLIFSFLKTPWLGIGPGLSHEKRKIVIFNIVNYINLLGKQYEIEFKTTTMKKYHLNAYDLTKKYLTEIINRAPIDIENTFDLYWWLNFNLRWYSARYKFLGLTGSYLNIESFFDTLDFQSWVITNHKTKNLKQVDDFINLDVKSVPKELLNLNKHGTWKIEFADDIGNMWFGRNTTPVELIRGIIK